MRYFHRTGIAPDRIIEQAHTFFGGRLALAEEGPRRRGYAGSIGRITVTAKPEGGHYTLVEVETDQVGESQADKLAKRFLSEVHAVQHSSHEVRGAY